MTREQFRSSYSVDAATMAKLDLYETSLSLWQSRMNLVAPSTLDIVWNRHFADSAQISSLVNDTATSASVWLDIGTGAGFPALVIALFSSGYFHLVEATSKKCQFLKHVVNVIGLADRVTIHQARIESLPVISAHFLIARACAPLVRLFDWGEQHGRDARWLLLKGRTVSKEIDDAEQSFIFDYRLIPSRTDPDARIVDAHAVRRKRR